MDTSKQGVATNMNWEYIAGFFDGEGCIYIKNSKVRLQLTQKPIEVLVIIQKFLKENDINSFIVRNKRNLVHSLRIKIILSLFSLP